MVEERSDEILEGAVNGSVAFLVVGDPLSATTHADLILRAKQRGIDVQVVHNASILTAAASCGLQVRVSPFRALSEKTVRIQGGSSKDSVL